MQIDGGEYAIEIFNKLNDVETYIDFLVKDEHSLNYITKTIDDKIKTIITTAILNVDVNELPLFIKFLHIQVYNQLVQSQYTLYGEYINKNVLDVLMPIVINYEIPPTFWNNISLEDKCNFENVKKHLEFLKIQYREKKLERLCLEDS